jgi:hypothetical protein
MGDSTGDAMAMIQAGVAFSRSTITAADFPDSSTQSTRSDRGKARGNPLQIFAAWKGRPKECPYIRIINQQQFHWDPIGFRKNAGVWEDLLCEVRTIQCYQDFRMHLP